MHDANISRILYQIKTLQTQIQRNKNKRERKRKILGDLKGSVHGKLKATWVIKKYYFCFWTEIRIDKREIDFWSSFKDTWRNVVEVPESSGKKAVLD